MSREEAATYIKGYMLVLRRVGRGWRIEQSTKAWPDPGLENWIHDMRDDIIAELQRRVVPIEPRTAPVSAGDKNPWRHTEEASFRMAWARQKLEQWRAEGLYPAVVWEPSIAIVNDLIPPQPLTVPAWARMEILWLLVHTKRICVESAPGVSMEFVGWPGGVA